MRQCSAAIPLPRIIKSTSKPSPPLPTRVNPFCTGIMLTPTLRRPPPKLTKWGSLVSNFKPFPPPRSLTSNILSWIIFWAMLHFSSQMPVKRFISSWSLWILRCASLPWSAGWLFRDSISSLSSRISFTFWSSFTIDLLLMWRARFAYFKVLRLSLSICWDDDRQHNMVVRQFPPNASFIRRVRLESW